MGQYSVNHVVNCTLFLKINKKCRWLGPRSILLLFNRRSYFAPSLWLAAPIFLSIVYNLLEIWLQPSLKALDFFWLPIVIFRTIVHSVIRCRKMANIFPLRPHRWVRKIHYSAKEIHLKRFISFNHYWYLKYRSETSWNPSSKKIYGVNPMYKSYFLQIWMS